MYDKYINNVIKKFAKTQRDGRYYNSLIIWNSSKYNIIKLSFYKLVQFLKDYISLQGEKTPIITCLCIVQYWLCKLDYKYKNVHKKVFINEHK